MCNVLSIFMNSVYIYKLIFKIFSILIFNMLNTDRNNLHKQKFLTDLSTIKGMKEPWDQKVWTPVL